MNTLHSINKRKQRRHTAILSITAFCILVACIYSYTQIANAANLSQWNAGRIISDSVFMNKDALNTTQIQAFLQSKNPSCDTQGMQPSEFGGGTRAQWGTSRGYPPPYICIKDYSESGKGAAQIIYDTAQQFNINPQVLIVLLQKEQGLITDTWPLPQQYKTATGYGCPDTAPCDSQYYGLTNQLQWSARMFKAIMTNSPAWYAPYVLGENTIRWSPNNSCGGSTVNIQNRATQALYNYTPYQPNQAALSAGYSTGDSCSAYGNRNFYLYFTDWFGSTIDGTIWRWSYVTQTVYANSNYTNPISSYEPSVQPDGFLYAEVKALNSGNQTWGKLAHLATNRPQDRDSNFYDSSWLSTNRPAELLETEVPPGSIGTFRFKIRAPHNTGTYREYFNVLIEGMAVLNDPGLYFVINVTHPVTARNSSNTTLFKGEILSKNNYLISPDTNSTFSLQPDGNLVLRNNFMPVWSTETKAPGASKFIFQSDGNLVLYTANMKPLWASGTDGSDAAKLILQEDGNLVAYSNSNAVIWQSGTDRSPIQFNSVTRIIPSGGEMKIGQRIENAQRSTMLFFQQDGNIVLYKGNRVLWASGTDGLGGTRLIMQGDGNLVLYDNAMKPVWFSKTYNSGPSRLELQGDDNLVIYKADEKPSWATYTNN